MKMYLYGNVLLCVGDVNPYYSVSLGLGFFYALVLETLTDTCFDFSIQKPYLQSVIFFATSIIVTLACFINKDKVMKYGKKLTKKQRVKARVLALTVNGAIIAFMFLLI